jgi:ATPase subunit of ABC transporter with duplicated ATPase domains
VFQISNEQSSVLTILSYGKQKSTEMKFDGGSQLHNPMLYQQQQDHLDDTDVYASIWQDVLHLAIVNENTTQKNEMVLPTVKWGGRGKGGRGIARRTVQPYDISLPDSVRLEYIGQVLSSTSSSANKSSSVLLLDDAKLNFLSRHVYGMVGPNGCGKSSLLRRIDSCKIPGFPVHITTLLLSSPLSSFSPETTITTMQYLIQKFRTYCRDRVQAVNRLQIHQLEEAIQSLDMSTQENSVNEFMDSIASYEDFMDDIEFSISENTDQLMCYVSEALEWMGITKSLHHVPVNELTVGQLAKVQLSLGLLCCTLCYCDLLLLDEITSALDISGLIQLRRLVQFLSSSSCARIEVGPNFNAHIVQSSDSTRRPTTIVLVSHDYDFLNDVVTDVVEFGVDKKLRYYNGNYNSYIVQRQQNEQRQINHLDTMQQKQAMMQKALDNIRSQPVHTSRGAKKKAKTINCQKKKMDRVLQNDPANDLSRNADLVKRAVLRKKYENEPDKSIHFQFRKCSSQWNEPLIVAVDVGHTFNIASVPMGFLERECPDNESPNMMASTSGSCLPGKLSITKKDGYLFDCLDLCIDERGTYCIMGESASGKSTLLKILAARISPAEGKVHRALNVSVEYIDFSAPFDQGSVIRKSSLQYLMDEYPTKTEQEVRSELAAFGLGSTQAQTQVCFLSEGEQCRYQLASATLRSNPQVLLLDCPTANLDVDSVDALIYGLRKWNGTVVMVCHDAYFIRSLEAHCFVLVASEGKLRRVAGGVEEYIRSFAAKGQ